MKSWQLKAFGPDKLELCEEAEPSVAKGQVLVRFRAASINYRDFIIANGWYNPNLKLPLVPLSDGAGEIVAVGDGVEELSVGDHVTPLFFPVWDGGPGSWDKRGISGGCEAPGVAREFGVYAASAVVKVPDQLSFEEAATLPCAALTAWCALTQNCNVQSGDFVLVQGTGGVSMFALQFAKAIGARVIVTSSSNEKLDKAKSYGADLLLNYKENENWGPKVAELTQGGVNAVVEIGGAGTLAQSIAACQVGGHIAIIGSLAGVKTELELLPIVGKNVHLHGQTVGPRDAYEAMLGFIERHNIKPVIGETFTFDAVPEALGSIAGGGHMGKLVVRF